MPGIGGMPKTGGGGGAPGNPGGGGGGGGPIPGKGGGGGGPGMPGRGGGGGGPGMPGRGGGGGGPGMPGKGGGGGGGGIPALPGKGGGGWGRKYACMAWLGWGRRGHACILARERRGRRWRGGQTGCWHRNSNGDNFSLGLFQIFRQVFNLRCKNSVLMNADSFTTWHTTVYIHIMYHISISTLFAVHFSNQNSFCTDLPVFTISNKQPCQQSD